MHLFGVCQENLVKFLCCLLDCFEFLQRLVNCLNGDVYDTCVLTYMTFQV